MQPDYFHTSASKFSTWRQESSYIVRKTSCVLVTEAQQLVQMVTD